MNTFSITEAVKFAWNAVRKNPGFFVVLSVLVLAVALGTEVVGEPETSLDADTFNGLDSIVYLLLLVANLILSIWVVRVGIDAADKKGLSFSNIVPSWEVVWKYVLSNIVVALILTIPTLLFVGVIIALGIGSIFGGLMTPVTFGLNNLFLLGALLVLFLFVVAYLGARLMFVSYFVVDQKLGSIESVKASWRVGRGVVLRIIGLMIVLVLINLAGMLALFVGLLITVPITIVAWAYAYRSLVGGHDSVPTPAGDFVEPVPTPTMGE